MALDKNFHWLLSFEIKYKSDSKSEMRTLSPLAPLAFGLAVGALEDDGELLPAGALERLRQPEGHFRPVRARQHLQRDALN